MQRRISIYQQELSQEIIDLFGMIGSSFVVEQVKEDIITVLDKDYYNEEPFDLETLRELIIQDLNQDVTLFIEPYIEGDFILKGNIHCFIKELPSGVYYFEDIITYIVVKNKEPLKKKIIKYIADKVSSEVIHTVREFISNNMNSSSTSKKLFMHRNTLNYRVDNFIELTNINVKTFKGANAIYLLYKY